MSFPLCRFPYVVSLSCAISSRFSSIASVLPRVCFSLAHFLVCPVRQWEKLAPGLWKQRGSLPSSCSFYSSAQTLTRRWHHRSWSPCDCLTNKRTNAQMHKRTNAQTHKRTNAQTHKRTNAQTHKHGVLQLTSPASLLHPSPQYVSTSSFLLVFSHRHVLFETRCACLWVA
jgi:hypothetical protein